MAFVGAVGSEEGMEDFTVVGDAANTAARLASAALAGEVLASEAACAAAGLNVETIERRELQHGKDLSEPGRFRSPQPQHAARFQTRHHVGERGK